MKKITFLLIFLSLISLSYGQAIEMSTVVPTSPVAVVDELRVIGTESDDTSEINIMTLGVDTSNLNPFQSQTLAIEGLLKNVKTISSGRDFFFIGSGLEIPSADIYDGGTLFINTEYFKYVSADIFRSPEILGPNTEENLSLSNISAQEIFVDDIYLNSPFEKGTVIKSYPPAQGITVADAAEQKKYHIYYPWETEMQSPTTPKCNSDGSLCSKDNCSACSRASVSECYDMRTVSIPIVYEPNGATYEKIGTVKFYCKPLDIYNGYNLDTTASSCRQYMVYSDNDTYIEGFTNGDEPLVMPIIDRGVPYDDSGIKDYLDAANGDLGEVCYKTCGNRFCDSDIQQLVTLDPATGEFVKIDNTFGNEELCSDASWSEEEGGWPIGSGLSCKAKEKVIDIYLLRCYTKSGTKRGKESIVQYRKVLCRQYNRVSAEYSAIPSANIDLLEKRYFFPDF